MPGSSIYGAGNRISHNLWGALLRAVLAQRPEGGEEAGTRRQRELGMKLMKPKAGRGRSGGF